MNGGKRITWNGAESGEPNTDAGSSRLSRRELLASVAAGSGATVLSATRSAGRTNQSDRTVDGPTRTPPVEKIPEGGLAENFELVSHLPLMDEYQYAGNEPLGIPRGSNGDITIAGDYVYVGSLIGYQPPLIVDVSNPRDPSVVGPIPDAVPGVGNGIEGIEASGDVLVIDQRNVLGRLGFDVPEEMPSRGLAIYDVSDPKNPELVARKDDGDRHTHTVSLWRDPQESSRVVAVQSTTGTPDIAVVDLSECLDGGEPKEVATWDFDTQTGISHDTHEAIMSTDGRRIYVSQLKGGVFLLDSAKLSASLRTDAGCKESSPDSTPGDDHCLTLLNPDASEREDTAPPFNRESHHTPIKIPGRPFLLALAESSGPTWDAENEVRIRADCPGAFTRIVYVGEDTSEHRFSMPGARYPETIGVFALPEQDPANCRKRRWKPDTAAFPAWFSPHNALVFPNVAFVTYYGAGLRAIDISNPATPREVGHFFNDPVSEVRWASYGLKGETETRPDGRAVRRPAPGPNHMFAFSYPVIHDGHLIYGDVHSGLYVLEYNGPHAEEIPDEGNCISGNPGGVEPGFEPCPPYGRTNWGQ